MPTLKKETYFCVEIVKKYTKRWDVHMLLTAIPTASFGIRNASCTCALLILAWVCEDEQADF